MTTDLCNHITDPRCPAGNLSGSLLLLGWKSLPAACKPALLIPSSPRPKPSHLPPLWPFLQARQLTSGPLHLLFPIWKALPPDPSRAGSLARRSSAHKPPSRGGLPSPACHALLQHSGIFFTALSHSLIVHLFIYCLSPPTPTGM